MNDVSKEENGDSFIGWDEEAEKVERTLLRLACAPAGNRLLGRLVDACDREREDAVRIRETVSVMGKMTPAGIAADRLSKWSGLMNAAAREQTEKRLGRLAPAGMSDFSKMRCSVAMDLAVPGEKASARRDGVAGSSGKRSLLFYRLSAIAAAVVLSFVCISLLMENKSEGIHGGADYLAGVSSAELNRQAIRVVEEGVNWNEEQGEAQMQYHVDYEDSVKMTDEKGHRVVVSVPKSRKVVVPVRVY